MMIIFRKFDMTTSVNKSLVILVMVMASNLSSGLSLRGGASVGVEKCDPSIIPRCVKLENFMKISKSTNMYKNNLRLPARMQTICMSLLKTIQEYDEAINEVMAPQSQGT